MLIAVAGAIAFHPVDFPSPILEGGAMTAEKKLVDL